MNTRRKVEWGFTILCALCVGWLVVAVASCTSMTVVVGTEGAAASAESDKGAVIHKPRPKDKDQSP